ncbi:MAG TPA: DNA repair protein RecO [Patescibacteria group bacterium]|nr:DNA repair protein RecO [Patescibacteria group bacterium]
MNQLVTKAIILSRTDYGEADRILTVLTPTYGKLRLLAKGVRRVKSKLAGGIELFSISEITYIKGRGDIGTLVSTRLITHYGHIIEDLDRTMAGYELIKQLNKITEDETEEMYFGLLEEAFAALNDRAIPLALVRFWFDAKLLQAEGQEPNLQTDETGKPLVADSTYGFDFEHMTFTPQAPAPYGAAEIKFLRLAFGGYAPRVLHQVQGAAELLAATAPLIRALRVRMPS